MMKAMLTESRSLVEDVTIVNNVAKLREMYTSKKRPKAASLVSRAWINVVHLQRTSEATDPLSSDYHSKNRLVMK